MSLFDVDFFGWAVARFQENTRRVPMPVMLDMLHVLSYADTTLESQDLGVDALENTNLDSMSYVGMIFPACPQGFQQQVESFY
eukprot:2304614-Amphidinium_carterae.1